MLLHRLDDAGVIPTTDDRHPTTDTMSGSPVRILCTTKYAPVRPAAPSSSCLLLVAFRPCYITDAEPPRGARCGGLAPCPPFSSFVMPLLNGMGDSPEKPVRYLFLRPIPAFFLPENCKSSPYRKSPRVCINQCKATLPQREKAGGPRSPGGVYLL